MILLLLSYSCFSTNDLSEGFFQVTQFVSGLFDSRTDLSTFKNHIRDFLVQSKEFSAQVGIQKHQMMLGLAI